MNNGDEVLRSWSAVHILRTLKNVSLPNEQGLLTPSDATAAAQADSLLFWINRRPDLAARALVSPLFSDRLLSLVVPAAPDGSAAFSKLREMCRHAVNVQERYLRQAQDTTNRNHVPLDDINESSNTSELPQEEVTLAATFMDDVLSGVTPDIFRTLESVFSPESASAIDGDSSPPTGINRLLDAPLCTAVRHHLTQLHRRLDMQKENGVASIGPCLSEQVMQRAARILALRRSGDSYASGETRDHAIPLVQQVPRSMTLPDALVRDSHLVHDYIDEERRMLTECLHSIPLPFQVRSRQELRRQAVAREALQTTTSLVRGDATIAAPVWARDEFSKQTIAPAEATPYTQTCQFAPDGSVEKISTSSIEPIPHPLEVSDRGPEEPVWIDDGVLTMVRGRFLVRRAREGKKPKPGEGKLHPRVMVEPKKRPREDDRLEGTGGTTSFNGKVAATSSTKVEDGAEKPRTSPDSFPSLAMPTATVTAKRMKRLAAGGGQGEMTTVSAVSTIGVAPSSREDLLQQVLQWRIPDTLREAFLIGLEPDAGRMPPSGVLRLMNGKPPPAP